MKRFFLKSPKFVLLIIFEHIQDLCLLQGKTSSLGDTKAGPGTRAGIRPCPSPGRAISVLQASPCKTGSSTRVLGSD